MSGGDQMDSDGTFDDPGEVTADNVREQLLGLVDRELTSPARAAAYAARWSPATAVEYVKAAVVFRAWCRPPSRGARPPRWLSYLPCTPETLALFAEYQLVEASPVKAPNTVRKWISGIRAWHRLHGVPVPDGVPALAVLTRVEATLRAHRWEPNESDPLDLDRIVALVGACDRERPRGLRDAAWLLVGYAAQFDGGWLRSLRLADFGPLRPEGSTVRREDGATIPLPHWAVAGRHDPATCPPCAADAWTSHLYGRGLTRSAYWLRIVDRYNHIAGVDPSAGRRALDGRIASASLGAALGELVALAGLTDAGRFTLTSVRAGGLAHLRAQGASVARLAEQAGLPTHSDRRIVNAVRSAETWPATVAVALDRVGDLP